jgi:dUTP pyrophosphatase
MEIEFTPATSAVEVKVKKLHPKAKLPFKATTGSAGFDLYTLKNVLLQPGQWKAVRTGLAFQLPSGYVMFLMPRSGVARKLGINLINSVGVLDSDYRSECILLLHNNSNKAVYIPAGWRIAQAVIVKLPEIYFKEVNELDKTERGAGGFGSTGVK